MQTPHSLLFSVALGSLTLAPTAHGEIKLPALIGDHMVLQQEAKANVWGTADPAEKITVQLGSDSVSTVADARGRWSIRLGGLKPGLAGDLTISGRDTITVRDVAVGEVWVASGQSNMEFPMRQTRDASREIAAADFPQIRLFTVPHAARLEPTDACEGKWEVCSPETVPHFSAVAYFFGRDLHRKLNVPVGLIHTSWGGTGAELWTPTSVLGAEPAFQTYEDRWHQLKQDFPQAKAAYDEEKQQWERDTAQARAEGKTAPRAPSMPRGGDTLGAPGCLWNGMIVPVLPFTIQGVIWYQGEANTENPRLYRRLFPTMIQAWRRAWLGLAEAENPDFPFLFVQLANFKAQHEQPTDSAWAELREAQFLTLDLPRTAMAVAIDVGEAQDIHPDNKQEVGRRLALAAEGMAYFIDTEFSGPLLSGAQVEEGKIRLSLRNADDLKAASGGRIKGFAIAGDDRKFVWANAEIDGDHVLVSSPEIRQPVAVRYGWADNPDCNLVNAAGLPASPFRTDDWPQSPAAPEK
jgi:sialate O-acetylesterase